jgi:hypothetical protein
LSKTLASGQQENLPAQDSDGEELGAPLLHAAPLMQGAPLVQGAPQVQDAPQEKGALAAPPPAPVKIQSNYVLINTKKKSTADSENKLPDIVRKADHLRTPASNPTKRTVPTRPVFSVKSSEKQRPVTGTETTTTTTPVATAALGVIVDGGETDSAVLSAAGTPEDAVERDADEEVYCDATPDYNLLRNGLGSTGIHSMYSSANIVHTL